MASKRDTSTLCLFDVDGTLTAPRQVNLCLVWRREIIILLDFFSKQKLVRWFKNILGFRMPVHCHLLIQSLIHHTSFDHSRLVLLEMMFRFAASGTSCKKPTSRENRLQNSRLPTFIPMFNPFNLDTLSCWGGAGEGAGRGRGGGDNQ